MARDSGGDRLTTPDTPAVTESLRERLIEALQEAGWTMSAERAVTHCWPLIESELQKRDEATAKLVAEFREWIAVQQTAVQKHTEEKARLVGEFRRLAAEAGSYFEEGVELAYSTAAQILEESKP